MQFAERAIQLAGDDAQVIAPTVWVFFSLLRRWYHAKALFLADRAIELNPNLSQAWNVVAPLGLAPFRVNMPARSTRRLARAARLNPADPVMTQYLLGKSNRLLLLRRQEEGVEWAEKEECSASPEGIPCAVCVGDERTIGRSDEKAHRQLHVYAASTQAWFPRGP